MVRTITIQQTGNGTAMIQFISEHGRVKGIYLTTSLSAPSYDHQVVLGWMQKYLIDGTVPSRVQV